MQYRGKPVSKAAKLLFPILVTVVVGCVAPDAVALVGFLMFGNLIRECGVMKSISETAQTTLANLVTKLDIPNGGGEGGVLDFRLLWCDDGCAGRLGGILHA